MRIAILTLPLHTNFGGILQCYALQTVLERMGHDITVLNTDFEEVDYKVRVELFVKRLIKTILQKESRFYGWKTEREITHKYTQAFIDRYIHVRNIKDLFLLKESEYDVIIVGSDQIWRSFYYQPIANAYLKFAKNWTSIKRIAYAASFGTDEWEYSQRETKECALLLNLFDAVSVRESSGIDLCKRYLKADAIQVLDPTLLLTKDDYMELVDCSNMEKHEGELLYYFLDVTPEKMNLASKLAKESGLNLYKANNVNTADYLHFEKQIQFPLEQWIAGFRDASFVVTDSFHGCVFSILFNKPFLVISNKKRGGSRFISLLSILGLQNRLVDERDMVLKKDIINYETINKKLNILRSDSFAFLKSSLS